MPKMYFHDLGFRNTLLNHWLPGPERLDKGQHVENYLFIRLRQLYGQDNIRYWRTSSGNEIDFIVTPDQSKEFAIEAKFKADNLQLSKYKTFTNAYPVIPIRMVAYESANPACSLFRL
jgi:predicted AAA+ superfamily ATPase